MRKSLAVSILLSLVLIGGATWFRVSNAGKVDSNLIATASKTIDWSEVTRYTQELGDTNAKSDGEPLTSTDVISRQLLLDYIDLAATGQNTDENMALLADKYAESLPTLNTSKKIDAFKLKTTSGSYENLKKYSDKMTVVLANFKSKASRYDNEANLYASSNGLGSVYTNTADELASLEVPLELVPLHLELVNSYYSSGSALMALMKTESDPAVAFAGIISLNQNINIEESVLDEITTILNSHGL